MIRRLGPLLALVVLAALTGCARPASPPTPSPQPAAVTATAAAATPVGAQRPPVPYPDGTETSSGPAVSSGPVSTPPAGSIERKRILDAARTKLGTTAELLVVQLYVQAGVALADVAPAGAPATDRRLMGLVRDGIAWKVRWSERPADATRTSLRAAVPEASAALVAKLRFDAPLAADDESVVRQSAEAAALRYARANGGASVGTLSVSQVRLAKDRQGDWWATVVVKPSNAGVEALPVYLERLSGTWKLIDLGTGIEPQTDTRFPSEVRGKL